MNSVALLSMEVSRPKVNDILKTLNVSFLAALLFVSFYNKDQVDKQKNTIL